MLLTLLSAVQMEPATPGTEVDFTWLFVKMLLVLGIVTVCAILFLKYVMPRTGLIRSMQKGRYFTVLGRYQIEQRKSLYLVEVGGRYLVIGTADHGISMLAELKKSEVDGSLGERE